MFVVWVVKKGGELWAGSSIGGVLRVEKGLALKNAKDGGCWRINGMRGCAGGRVGFGRGTEGGRGRAREREREREQTEDYGRRGTIRGGGGRETEKGDQWLARGAGCQ